MEVACASLSSQAMKAESVGMHSFRSALPSSVREYPRTSWDLLLPSGMALAGSSLGESQFLSHFGTSGLCIH